MPHRTLAISLLAALLACGGGHDPSFAQRSSEAVFANGNNLNGNNLNGNNLNGNNLNGTALGSEVVSVSFRGVTLGDRPLDWVWLWGTIFVGANEEDFFFGRDFYRAEFQGTTDNGSVLTLRIDGMQQQAPPDDDVWGYKVSFFNGVSWLPLCLNAAGSPSLAIPVNGVWNHAQGVPGGGAKIDDPSAFTFSCMGTGAIAKCVYPIGYKPWKSVKGHSLDRWHQTCVRLIRADFCGNGKPYTTNGQRVDLYDGLGVQRDTEPLWLFEADWDEHGARCFNPLNRSHALLIPCFNDRALSTCGLPIDFMLGAVLMNKTPLPLLQ
jgi:hypothetical protein